MDVFLASVITGAVCSIVFGTVFGICYHRGLFIRTVHDHPEHPVIRGEVIREPEEVFFDEHDLAVMEAHAERSEFVHTEILLNGIKAGLDGTVPPEKEGSWWRR